MNLTASTIDKMEDSKENRELLFNFYNHYMSGNRRLLTWVWNQLHLKFDEEEFDRDHQRGKKDINWFDYVDWNWLKETIKKGIEKSNLKSYAGDYRAETSRRWYCWRRKTRVKGQNKR